MSYLSHALEDLMKEKHMRSRDLARASGIDESTISRWRLGQQISINDEDLQALAEALSRDREEQAKLVIARMRDLCRGPGAELVEVRLAGRTVREEPTAYCAKLPPDAEHDLAVLGANIMKDSDLRQIIAHLAKLFEDPTKKPLVKKTK